MWASTTRSPRASERPIENQVPFELTVAGGDPLGDPWTQLS